MIGAGFTGLSCARRLAELNPSDKIILLEAREIGQNASGRNSGYAVAHSHFSGRYQRINLDTMKGLTVSIKWALNLLAPS